MDDYELMRIQFCMDDYDLMRVHFHHDMERIKADMQNGREKDKDNDNEQTVVIDQGG